MMENLFSFICFAFVASITPGPTNFLILSQSSRLGLGKTFPIVVSASIGAAALVCLTGIGVGKALLAYPFVKEMMGWLGVLWLTKLAWQIASQPVKETDNSSSDLPTLGVVGGFLMQAVNPKAWLMAVAVISVYATSDAHYFWNVSYLSAVSGDCDSLSDSLGIGWPLGGIIDPQADACDLAEPRHGRDLAGLCMVCDTESVGVK